MAKQAKAPVRMLLMLAVVFTLWLLMLPVGAHADPPYTRNAALKDSANYPGVYYVSAVKGDSNATIGIPSLAKQTLTGPTTESPAIEIGAALPYEVREAPTVYRTLPGATVVDESTFEGTAAIYVVIPDGCTTIQPNAFKGCTQLKYIRIPATVEQIGASAFDGCSGVYVIGKEFSAAETLCQGSSNFTFIIGVDE